MKGSEIDENGLRGETTVAEKKADDYRTQRKREFLEEGLFDMNQVQILELLLFYGIPRTEVEDLARHLLELFGSFSGVMDAPFLELRSIEGISDNTAVLIKMLPPLCNYYLKEKHSRNLSVRTPERMKEILIARFVDCTEERIVVMFLNAKYEIVFCDAIADGSLGEVRFNLKYIVQLLSQYPATYVVLAHNHPSGNLTPTSEDIFATRQIATAVHLINVQILDHLIISGNRCASLKESGICKDIFTDFPTEKSEMKRTTR